MRSRMSEDRVNAVRQIVAWSCMAVFAMAACKGNEAPPAPVSPPDLQIISAGDAPRRVLRYKPGKGTTQKLEVEIDVNVQAGDMGGPMPTMVIAMTVAVDAVMPTGQMKLRATIDDVTARDNPESKVPAVALAGPLEALKGVAIDALLSPNGRLTGAKVDRGGKELPKDIDTQVSSLVASFEQTMMPLPDEPVGVGAVWRNSRAIEQNGMSLKSVNSVSLASIEGDVVTLALDTDIHGQDQTVKQGDLTIEVKDILGNGGGKTRIDLAKLAVTSDLAAEFRSVMTAAGDPQPTTMTMTTVSKVKPL